MKENRDVSNILCVIPARGGSQRIPRKNLRHFAGKPIIHHAIKAALESHCFEEVMVSTDDEEIAEVSISAGAKVPFLRSDDASSHHATTGEVWAEVVREYHMRGSEFRSVFSILPTAVFVTPRIIREALQVFENQPDWDGLMSVVPYSPPIQRALKINEGTLRPLWPEHSSTRSQDLQLSYYDAGQFYVFRPEFMLRFKSMRQGNVGAFPLSALSVQDIDEEEDWMIAEQKYALLFPHSG